MELLCDYSEYKFWESILLKLRDKFSFEEETLGNEQIYSKQFVVNVDGHEILIKGPTVEKEST